MRCIRRSLAAVLAALAAPVGMSQTLVNSDFESPNLGTGFNAWTYLPVGTGWIFEGQAALAANGSAWFSDAYSGTQFAVLQNAYPRDSSPWGTAAGSIRQSVNGFTVGQSYRLSFYAKDRTDFQVGASDNPINVRANGTTILSAHTPASEWGLVYVDFLADATNIEFRFESNLVDTGEFDTSTYIDAVRIELSPDSVPEPLTLVLMASAASIGWTKIKRSKRLPG